MMLFHGLASLAACDGGPAEQEAVGISGEITAERDGERASVLSAAVFGFAQNGKALLYMSPNPDATCEDAATVLAGPGPEWDPSAVHEAGACTIFVLADYAGEAVEYVDDPVAATVSLYCGMDDGEWVREEGDAGAGYVYTGPVWQGAPSAFTVSIGDDLTLGLEMSAYDGNFIYDNMLASPASGSVEGVTPAAPCAALAQTPALQ